MRTFAISVAAGITVASGMAYALQATSFPPIQSPPQTASDDDRLFHQARDASALIFDASPEYVARGLEVTTTPQVSRSDLYEGEPAPAEPANGATGPSAVDVESTSAVPSVETTAASGGQSREQGLSQAAPAARLGNPRSAKSKPKNPVLRESKKPVARPAAPEAISQHVATPEKERSSRLVLDDVPNPLPQIRKLLGMD